ncbi:MAG: hypothetical protein CL535_07285 [Ahrensia sp.]|nr:hypothetical protein [Ahrensia sp.]
MVSQPVFECETVPGGHRVDDAFMLVIGFRHEGAARLSLLHDAKDDRLHHRIDVEDRVVSENGNQPDMEGIVHFRGFLDIADIRQIRIYLA